MPDFLESKLRQTARKKGFKGKHADAYVYGTMNNVGAMHGSKITAKGREMERKHEADMKTEAAAPKPASGGHRLRTMRIERHHDKAGTVTGHTVHHEMEPKRVGKSGAYIEHHTESYPFGANDHKGMMAHVAKHLAMGSAETEPDGDEEA